MSLRDADPARAMPTIDELLGSKAILLSRCIGAFSTANPYRRETMRRYLVAPLVLALTVLTIVVAVPAASAGGNGLRRVPEVDEGLRRRSLGLDRPRGPPGRRAARSPVRDGRPDAGSHAVQSLRAACCGTTSGRAATSAPRGTAWATAPWAPRAYFQAVTKGGAMFVIGGQDLGGRRRRRRPSSSTTCGRRATACTGKQLTAQRALAGPRRPQRDRVRGLRST